MTSTQDVSKYFNNLGKKEAVFSDGWNCKIFSNGTDLELRKLNTYFVDN